MHRRRGPASAACGVVRTVRSMSSSSWMFGCCSTARRASPHPAGSNEATRSSSVKSRPVATRAAVTSIATPSPLRRRRRAQTAKSVVRASAPSSDDGDRDDGACDVGERDDHGLDAGALSDRGRDDSRHDRSDAWRPDQADGSAEDDTSDQSVARSTLGQALSEPGDRRQASLGQCLDPARHKRQTDEPEHDRAREAQTIRRHARRREG